MNIEAAQLVFAIIVTIGAIVWLIALQFTIAAFQLKRATPGSADALDFTDKPPRSWYFGSAEVDGEPGVLSRKAAHVLARESSLSLGSLKVLEQTDRRVRFERIGQYSSHQTQGLWFSRGLFQFNPSGPGRTRIDYAIELREMRGLLIGGLIFLFLGLLVLVVGGWFMYVYVVTSPDPALRWQTIQALQMFHFLWPPFLFGSLYRYGKRNTLTRFEALVHNLPYFES